MAKPFYSIEEVCELLGKDADGVRALVRDGSLREFRDAGKIFFKAEDVDKLAGKPPASADDSGEIDLEPTLDDDGDKKTDDKDEVPAINDVTGGTSLIGLEPMEGDDDKREGTSVTTGGISVFDDDEVEIDADPMADTQVTSGAIDDEVALDSAGSGSGLLDLTREADDTSLGAELLDDIYPGEDADDEEQAEEEPAAEAEEVEEEEEELPEEMPAAEAGEAVAAPVAIVAGDPSEGIFSGLMVGALILLGVAGTVVAGVVQGYLPDYALLLSNNFWFFLGGAAGVVLISLIIGWLLGRSLGGKRR